MSESDRGTQDARSSSEGPIRRGPWSPIAVASLLAALAGGCSIIADTDRTQCREPADCAATLGGAVADYTCENNLCQTNVECKLNSDCMSTTEKFCSLGGTCVQCIGDADCTRAGDKCVDNACIDPVWGCLNQPDKRPPAAQPSATFTMKAGNPVTMTPLAMLTARACSLDHLFFPGCDSTHMKAVADYQPSTGVLTVSDYPQGVALFLKLDAPEGIQPVDYMSNRPIRDSQDIGDVNFIPYTVLPLIARGTSLVIDPKKPTALFRIFDCAGVPAAGVTLSMKEPKVPPADLITAYTETNAPRWDLMQTTAAGQAGFFNLPTGVLVKAAVTISEGRVIEYDFVTSPERAHKIDLYPGVFTVK